MPVGIYHLGGIAYDSNIYLITDEVTTLIDAGSGHHFPAIRSDFERFGVGLKDIKLLINTHCHFDHTGSDFDFVDASKCEVAIHESEADLLRKGDRHITRAEMFGVGLRPVEVSRELREGDKIKLGELTLEVLHTPGHSAGCISLYERDKKILFSGDTLFCDGVGRTDLPTGDADALVRSVERLSKLGAEQMYPGHGSFMSKDARKCILEVARTVYL